MHYQNPRCRNGIGKIIDRKIPYRLLLNFVILALWTRYIQSASASEDPPAQPSIAADANRQTSKPKVAQAEHKKRIGYVTSKAVSTKREPQPPGYVKTLDKHAANLGLSGFEDYHWLELGIEHRTRFELRDDFYQTDLETDSRFFMRTRGYVGIKEVLDPLRFGFEFQDSRKLGSELRDGTGETNKADILQAFAELYFKDAFGEGQPLRFQFGRLSFDSVDRRLVARNHFRNTTNSFDGFRFRIGEMRSPWELEFFAMQPVERRLTSPDRADEERWFYGVAGYWRRWSPGVILEPYYFVLDEDRKDPDRPDREIHTLGLHGYGLIGKTGFDYDFNVAFQFGNDGDRSHRGFASHGELGYSFDHSWKPRVAFWLNYASGDRNPDDGVTERFDRLFGASHGMSGYSDLFDWRNLINPAIRVSARPTKKLRLEAFYRTYWLASDTDAFIRAGLRDRGGNSGDFIGQEIDMRARYQLTRNILLEVGYAHFLPGPFVRNTEPLADDSDFFYMQTTLRF